LLRSNDGFFALRLAQKTSQRFLQSIWAFIVWHCILAMQLRLAAASYIQAYAVLALPHEQKTTQPAPMRPARHFRATSRINTAFDDFSLLFPATLCASLTLGF